MGAVLSRRQLAGRALGLAILIGGGFALFLVLIAFALERRRPAPTTNPTTSPATLPATTQVAQKPKPVTTLLELVRASDTNYPTTQPLNRAVGLKFSARIELAQVPYICPRGDLWLTHDNSRTLREVIREAPSERTHVLRDRVKFVHWGFDNDKPTAELILDQPFRWASLREGEIAMNDVEFAKIEPEFSRAWSWGQQIVVPGKRGISVLTREGKTVKCDTVILSNVSEADDAKRNCHVAIAARGLLAWVAGEDGKIAAYREGKWEFIEQAAPQGLEYMVPYADGSALAISQTDRGIELAVLPFDQRVVDDAKVKDILSRLGSDLPEDRTKARTELANLGPTARPTVERLVQDESQAAKLAVRQVLGSEQRVRIGGLLPSRGPGKVVKHLEGGGVLLFFAGGVSQEDASGKLQTVSPAWLAITPGHAVSIVDEQMVRNIRPDMDESKITLRNYGGEWFTQDPARGIQRFMGNHVETLVPSKSLRTTYTRIVGQDSTGRWVMTNADQSRSLIIDPTLPNTTPRLPVWSIDFSKEAGWSLKDDLPAIRSGGAFSLGKQEWVALPAEQFSKDVTEHLLAKDQAHQPYTGGLVDLVTPSGKTVSLPDVATGQGYVPGKAAAFDVGQDRVLLFNQPGRMSLLKWNPERTQLTLLGNFSRNMPRSGITRVWQDTHGRIVVAYATNTLAIVFPDGMIPGEIQNMMSAKALENALGEEE
jgi:hypothetical protein